MAEGESKGTVLVAGAANLGIAVAKIAAGVVSGSSAMLAEGAHSIADTLNQVFLLTALSRSKKPADEKHPFGYGMERYFWSLLAAVGIFVLGAGFSFYEGVHSMLHPEPLGDLLVSFIVLAISFVFEGISWLKAVRQLRSEARHQDVGVLSHVVKTPDPTVKTVAFEDSAALIGLLLAAGGLGLHALTGSAVWDAVASMAIGVLLIVVAIALGNQSKSMLIGSSVPSSLRERIRDTIVDSPGVDRVIELLTMRLGPDDVMVAARVDVADHTKGADLERLADEVDRRVCETFDEVKHVFLDPTSDAGLTTEEHRAGEAAHEASRTRVTNG
jgi:cation diffusion facilitator family transporter